MANITHGLFIQETTGNFLDNPTGPTYGIDSLVPFNAGDLIGFEIYFFGDYIPSLQQAPLIRHAGATITARLRAQGNQTIYATDPQVSEIVPVATSVTQTQAGDNFHYEKQAVVFDAVTGTFRLTFFAPSSLTLPLGNPAYYATGTTPPIKANATAAEIESAINLSVKFWRYSNHSDGPYSASQVPSSALIRVTDWTAHKGFTLQFGSLVSNNTTNAYVYALSLASFDDSQLQRTYGWLVNLLLDGNGHTFNDLFLAANAPAYFEVILNPSGASAQMFQRQITAAGGGGGGDHEPPPVPGVLVNIDGVLFDGSYDNPVPIGAPIISHGIADDYSSLIWRQKYHQREAKWTPLPIGGGGCPYNTSAIAVDESPLQWTTIGDIVEFDRVWALIPNARRRPGSYSKTYKSLQGIRVNGFLDGPSLSIASRTAIIGADYFYAYFNIVVEGIPVPQIPDIAVVHNGPFHYYELFGGFNGTSLNNYGYVLIGADTRSYMGPITERVLIYGQ